MKALTLVLPHYRNLEMLAEQLRVWADYPTALRERLHVVIVDDCSEPAYQPRRESIAITGLGSIRLFRLLEKKRWNWLACRNLGATVATTDWMVLTDIDHVLPMQTLRALLVADLTKSYAYRFKRVTATRPWPYDVRQCPEYKPHNDSWLLTRRLFFDDRVGGYDERLSGCYGTSGEFRDRLVAAARVTVMLDSVLVRYPREVIADASTDPALYTRKNDPVNDTDLAQRKAERAALGQWRPLHGLVPWEQVA